MLETSAPLPLPEAESSGQPFFDEKLAGTVPYMSPEQLHGQRVDARSDIFAMRAVLYEMLTGKKAFPRMLIESGRAVLFPIYKGTFERGSGLKPICWPNTSSTYRDNVIFWSKDLSRSIDYLETRPDINSNALAYEGDSWGQRWGESSPLWKLASRHEFS